MSPRVVPRQVCWARGRRAVVRRAAPPGAVSVDGRRRRAAGRSGSSSAGGRRGAAAPPLPGSSRRGRARSRARTDRRRLCSAPPAGCGGGASALPRGRLRRAAAPRSRPRSRRRGAAAARRWGAADGAPERLLHLDRAARADDRDRDDRGDLAAVTPPTPAPPLPRRSRGVAPPLQRSRRRAGRATADAEQLRDQRAGPERRHERREALASSARSSPLYARQPLQSCRWRRASPLARTPRSCASVSSSRIADARGVAGLGRLASPMRARTSSDLTAGTVTPSAAASSA